MIMHQIRYKPERNVAGSVELYNMVRAALVARGSSLNAQCKANGINRQTAEKSLRGERYSRRAQSIRDGLFSELFETGDAK